MDNAKRLEKFKNAAKEIIQAKREFHVALDSYQKISLKYYREFKFECVASPDIILLKIKDKIFELEFEE